MKINVRKHLRKLVHPKKDAYGFTHTKTTVKKHNRLIGKYAKVHPELTTDPSDKRGEVGRITDVNKYGDVTLDFGDKKGKYEIDALMNVGETGELQELKGQYHTKYFDPTYSEHRKILERYPGRESVRKEMTSYDLENVTLIDNLKKIHNNKDADFVIQLLKDEYEWSSDKSLKLLRMYELVHDDIKIGGVYDWKDSGSKYRRELHTLRKRGYHTYNGYPGGDGVMIIYSMIVFPKAEKLDGSEIGDLSDDDDF